MKISVDQYLVRLSNDLKYPDLFTTLSFRNYKLHIPDFEVIEITQTDEVILMSSPVGKLIENLDEDKVLAYLLNANYLGQGTGKSFLALHHDNVTIVLSQTIFLEIDYLDFKERVEQMLNYIDYLKGHLLTKIPTFLKE